MFPGDGHGWFAPRIDLPVGVGASDIQVADLQQDGRLDILYTDRLSGQVGVLHNLGGGAFSSPVLYRRRRGALWRDRNVHAIARCRASNRPRASPPGYSRRVVLPRSSRSTRARTRSASLPAPATAGLPTPRSSRHRATRWSSAPSISATAARPGLAILTSDGLFIERSDGDGGFLAPTEINVGFEPNGLTVADLTGDGNADLLVSNPLGDVQVLLGNGNGSFKPPREPRPASLAGGLCSERRRAGRIHLRRSVSRTSSSFKPSAAERLSWEVRPPGWSLRAPSHWPTSPATASST